jgi:hypothetical protein
VIAIGQAVVPIEVKAGKTGRLKSLHAFLRAKKREFGMRFNTDVPSMLDTNVTYPDGEKRPLRLLSPPLYLAGQCRRLCRSSLRVG